MPCPIVSGAAHIPIELAVGSMLLRANVQRSPSAALAASAERSENVATAT
jgi:hypothetical protein